MSILSPSEKEMLKLLLLFTTIYYRFMKQESQFMFEQRTFALCFIESKQIAGIMFCFNHNFHRFCLIMCVLIIKHRMMSLAINREDGENKCVKLNIKIKP